MTFATTDRRPPSFETIATLATMRNGPRRLEVRKVRGIRTGAHYIEIVEVDAEARQYRVRIPRCFAARLSEVLAEIAGPPDHTIRK